MPVANMNSAMGQSPADAVSHRPGVQAAHDHSIDEMTEDDRRRPAPPYAEAEKSRPGDLTAKHKWMHQCQLRQHDKAGERNWDGGESQPLKRRGPVEGGPEEVGIEDRPDGTHRRMKCKARGPPYQRSRVPTNHRAEKADEVAERNT